jgi:plasmid segregation protein ParM
MTENWNVKALDDGYGDFKFDGTGKPDLIPAFATTFREKSDENMLSKQEKGMKYVASEINGYKYVVGEYAMKLDPNIRWTGGENKHSDSRFPVILKTALGMMTTGAREVIDILVMNLPIKYDTAERREELTKIVRGTHDVSVSYDGTNFQRRSIVVEDVIIKKQPFGSLCDLMLNGMGEVDDYSIAKGFNVIVDIGARTLNVLTVNALDVVPELTTQTSDGMYTSYMQVGSYLENEFGGLIPDGKLPLIVKDRELRGRDLTPLIDRVYANQANTIINTLDKLFINSWNFVDNIILTGGGAEILKPYFNGRFNGINTIYLDRYANVRGLRKYGLKLSKKRAKKPSTISAQIGSNRF